MSPPIIETIAFATIFEIRPKALGFVRPLSLSERKEDKS